MLKVIFISTGATVRLTRLVRDLDNILAFFSSFIGSVFAPPDCGNYTMRLLSVDHI
jgi:hypothetical protein